MANDATFQESLVVQDQRPMLRFNVLCAGLDENMVKEGLVFSAPEELPVEVEAAAAAAAIVVEEESVAEVATVPLGEGEVTDRVQAYPSLSHHTLSSTLSLSH